MSLSHGRGAPTAGTHGPERAGGAPTAGTHGWPDAVWCRRNAGADFSYDRVRATREIRTRETQEVDSGLEEAVLPLVVCRETVAMVLAVVLEAQPCLGIVQVEASEENTPRILDRNLCLWARQPPAHQQQAKARLHRRLRLGFGQLEHTASLGQTRDLVMSRDVGGEILLSYECRLECLIDRHHGLHQRKTAGQVEAGP